MYQITPVKISIADETDAINMNVTAAEVVGESYQTYVTLIDEKGDIKFQDNFIIKGNEYVSWDRSINSIINMIQNKFPFIKLS